MSICPIAYNENTQIYKMLHHEFGHEFDIALADIRYTLGIDGSDQFNFVTTDCLVCDSSSIHPIGGGAAPPDIQLLFSRLIGVKSCPCGVLPDSKPDNLNKSHAKMHCEQMDGKGRWQVT